MVVRRDDTPTTLGRFPGSSYKGRAKNSTGRRNNDRRGTKSDRGKRQRGDRRDRNLRKKGGRNRDVIARIDHAEIMHESSWPAKDLLLLEIGSDGLAGRL
jgi:hypothetical protein